jgi:hypothetical protein
MNKGPLTRKPAGRSIRGGLPRSLRLGLLSFPPRYGLSSRRSNTTVEKRRRKATWAEGEIGKAVAEDNTVGEGRDRDRERGGGIGGGPTEQEFRQRIRERLDRIDERLDMLDERVQRLER